VLPIGRAERGSRGGSGGGGVRLGLDADRDGAPTGDEAVVTVAADHGGGLVGATAWGTHR
jgi:hypothetical protein